MYIQPTNTFPRNDLYPPQMQSGFSSCGNRRGSPWQSDVQGGNFAQGMLGSLLEITKNLTQIVQSMVVLLSGGSGNRNQVSGYAQQSEVGPMWSPNSFQLPSNDQSTSTGQVQSTESPGLTDTLTNWGKKAWSVVKEYGTDAVSLAAAFVPSGKIASWAKKAYDWVKNWF